VASNVSDNVRRSEILQRTRVGLQEDIEDLRGQLLEALPDYEQRLRRRTDALPEWLVLPGARLRHLFHFSEDSVEPEAIVGPRCVALGAGRLEGFVEDWLEPATEELQREQIVAEYAALVAYLESLAAESRRVAAEADDKLERWRDGVLAQLDQRRANDVDALEELVQEGEVGRGGTARQEIADLWEEQRRRARDLQVAWAPIRELVEEGLEASQAGVDELRQMARRARQGLCGADDELAALLEGVDDRPVVDEAGSETLPEVAAETDVPGVVASEPVDRPSGDVQPDDGEVDAAGDTVPDDGFVHGILPLEEPTSEPEMGALESSSVSDYSEPQLVDPASSTAPPASRPYTRKDSGLHDTMGLGDIDPAEGAARDEDARDEDAPRDKDAAGGGGEAPPSQPTQAPPDKDTAASEPQPDPLEARCFRIRRGFVPVGGMEVAVVLAPPVAFLSIMGAASLLHLMGVGAGFDPLARWSWAPAALAVAAAWLVLVPLGLSWRVRWSGWRAEIVRRADVEEYAELRADAEHLSLDRHRWAWSEMDTPSLRRWDSPLDDTFGWVLRLAPSSDPLIELVAPAGDRARWQNSPVKLVEVPYEAWQLDRHTFARLRSQLDDADRL
jgi:hypothetical protein